MPSPFNRRFVSTSAVAALAASASLVLAASPASADTVTKTDVAGDTIPRLDITKVTYTNGPGQVRVRLRIPDLERKGTARLQIGPPRSDISYIAAVTVKADGSLSKRFSFATNTTNPTKSCAFGATWEEAEGHVSIAVPHSCLKLINNKKPLYIAGRTGNGDNTDWAPAAEHLARG